MAQVTYPKSRRQGVEAYRGGGKSNPTESRGRSATFRRAAFRVKKCAWRQGRAAGDRGPAGPYWPKLSPKRGSGRKWAAGGSGNLRQKRAAPKNASCPGCWRLKSSRLAANSNHPAPRLAAPGTPKLATAPGRRIRRRGISGSYANFGDREYPRNPQKIIVGVGESGRPASESRTPSYSGR